MPFRFIVMGALCLGILVISVVAIVMSTSAGTDTCESLWKSIAGEDEDDTNSKPQA